MSKVKRENKHVIAHLAYVFTLTLNCTVGGCAQTITAILSLFNKFVSSSLLLCCNSVDEI